MCHFQRLLEDLVVAKAPSDESENALKSLFFVIKEKKDQAELLNRGFWVAENVVDFSQNIATMNLLLTMSHTLLCRIAHWLVIIYTIQMIKN